MYKYIAEWGYNGARNKNTFVEYFQSESPDLSDVSDRIRKYICIKYNWNDIRLHVTIENIKHITV